MRASTILVSFLRIGQNNFIRFSRIRLNKADAHKPSLMQNFSNDFQRSFMQQVIEQRLQSPLRSVKGRLSTRLVIVGTGRDVR